MITTVTSVQRFATKTLYTRARATDGSTMLAPMSPGAGKGLKGGRGGSVGNARGSLFI
mgnify:CR=1 FL=1